MMLIGFAIPLLSLVAGVPGDTSCASVRVDSTRHQVVVTAGPWHRTSMGGGMMAMHAMHHMASATTFTWPVDGWVRSLRFRARTGDGHDVSRSALHHLAVVNLGRRDLFYQVPERMFEMGSETADIVLPGAIAIPVDAGTPMALTIAWQVDETLLPDVVVELTMDWVPAGTAPLPIAAMPVTMQIVTLAGTTSFDLPPGERSWATLYSPPVAGTVLAAGGHLHDFGTAIVLRDLSLAGSSPVLSLASQHTGSGHVTGIERMLPGAGALGKPLYAGHVYQLEGHYLNSTGMTIPDGGMAFLVVMFAPDRPAGWPVADPHAASWQRFLAQIGVPQQAD